jgi:hypothetical protein
MKSVYRSAKIVVIRSEPQLTFANKMSFWIHETNFFGDFVVDRFIFGETVETQTSGKLEEIYQPMEVIVR